MYDFYGLYIRMYVYMYMAIFMLSRTTCPFVYESKLFCGFFGTASSEKFGKLNFNLNRSEASGKSNLI
jgi:hypothetical protein